VRVKSSIVKLTRQSCPELRNLEMQQNNVFFLQADKKYTLLEKELVKKHINKIFQESKTILGSIQYIFCSDAFVLKINQDFLKHDFYTDIITFPLSAKGEAVVAEIYISVDRVKENAKTLGTSFREEMLRVLFHGALHLCGFKDKKKSEIVEMRAQEDHYLRLFAKQLKKHEAK
jgi:probable rRNA maturation factor